MGQQAVRRWSATPRRSLPARAVSAVAAIAALSACSSASVPDTGIPEQNAALVVEGDALYQLHCADCHGSDLRGTDKGPSHLSIVYEPGHHGDAAFALAVYNGVRQHHWPFGDMPPVEGLDDDDIARIVAFVRENQRVSGFEPYPP